MGSVYRAFDLKLGRVVALKLVSAEDETSELFLRFVREGAAAARIRHPNVVQVYDAGSENGCAFLAMQLLEGETLAEKLARVTRLPLSEAVDVILPICSAMAAAHQAGVLHRDLKPANIFLADMQRGTPEPYLLDFGISKLDGLADAALTQNTQLLGTPFYLAPEQADGAPGSAWADQYSLALCLYECLLGVRPFEQHKTSLMKLLRHIAEGNVPAPRQVDASIPLALDAVLTRALATDPTARFGSMREFGAALLPFASLGVRHLWQGAFSDEPSDQERSSAVEAPSPLGPDLAQVRIPSIPSSEVAVESSILLPPPSSGERSTLHSSRPSKGPASSRRFNSVGVEKYDPPRPEQRSLLAHVFFFSVGFCALTMSIVLVTEAFRDLAQGKATKPATPDHVAVRVHAPPPAQNGTPGEHP